MSDDKNEETMPPEADKPDAEAAWKNHKAFLRDMRRLHREEMRKKYPLIGTSLETRPEHKEAFDNVLNLLTAAETMMITGAQLKRQYNKQLWELVYQHYPETEGYSLTLDHATKHITLTGAEED